MAMMMLVALNSPQAISVDSGQIWLHDLDVCGFIIGLVLLNEPGDVESEPADDGVAVMNFLAAKGVA